MGGHLFVFVEYLCKRRPKITTKNIKNYSSILAIVNHWNWLDDSPPLIMSRKGEVRESVGFCTLRKSAEEDYLQAQRILEKLFGKKLGVAES